MTMTFSNKVVAVTGGTEGIGKALVQLLLAQGANVATCGRNQDKLYKLQVEHPTSPLHVVVADVSIHEDCQKFIQSTLKTFGKIDVLINNAGISMRAMVKDLDMSVLERVMNVNFWGSVYCTKLALPSITANKGTIVGVSSIAGYSGLPGRSGCLLYTSDAADERSS